MGRTQMPVGTIRHWQGGDVIKAGENNIFHSGWIALQTSESLENIGRDCDRMANEMVTKKEPINGELFLDHEINEFERDDKGNHPFTAENFKQYKGFYGAGKYSFRNEFSKRFMADKIKLHDDIQKELLEENEAKGGDNNGANKKIVLSAHEITNIKKAVKNKFKFTEKIFSTEDAKKLQGIVKRTYEQLNIGINFPEGSNEKKVYDNAIKVATELPENYQRIGIKRKLKEDSLNEIVTTFKDNWGVRESVRKLLDDKYGEYVRKYSKQISDDEAKDQEETFGVKLDDDFETFYKKLFKKVEDDKKKFEGNIQPDIVDLNKYVGKTVIYDDREMLMKKDKNGKFYLIYDDEDDSDESLREYPEEKELKEQIAKHENFIDFFSKHVGETVDIGGQGYDWQMYTIKKDDNGVYVWKVSNEEETKDNKHLKWYIKERYGREEIQQMKDAIISNEQKYPFKELIYLRFETLYNKKLDGNWNMGMLPVIYNLERIINELPKGHFRSNSEVSQVINKNTGSDGYAFYSPDAKEINFSDKAANAFQIWGNLKGHEEFNSTCTHEIGHAVSNKFGRSGNLEYKKFVVACGWDYQYLKLRGDEHATGEDKKIQRTGSRSMSHLLTDYAETSPEEAFAEYYSIYFMNHQAIDKWLDTNDASYLNKKSQLVAKKSESTKRISDFFEGSNTFDKQSKMLKSLGAINASDKIKVDLINPWHVKYTHNEQMNANERKAEGLARAREEYMKPIVVIKNKLNEYTCIDGSHRNEGCKLKKRLAPAIVIDEEVYHHLKEDYSFDDIVKFAFTEKLSDKYPLQVSEPVFMQGLPYRNEILDRKDVIANRERLEIMRRIFHSQQLAKAIQELFSFDKIRSVLSKPTLLQNEEGVEEDLLKAKLNNLISEYKTEEETIDLLREQIDGE